MAVLLLLLLLFSIHCNSNIQSPRQRNG